MVPGSPCVVDALIRLGEKSAHGCGLEITRGSNHDDIGITGQWHKCLAAQRVPFHYLYLERKLNGLTAEYIDYAVTPSHLDVNFGQAMMPLG